MEGGRILHKFLRQISLYLLITIILVMLLAVQPVEPVQQLTYSQLNALIRNNQVRTAVLIGDRVSREYWTEPNLSQWSR